MKKFNLLLLSTLFFALNLFAEPILIGPVQSDWNESDTSSPAYITNKPYGIITSETITNIVHEIVDEMISLGSEIDGIYYKLIVQSFIPGRTIFKLNDGTIEKYDIPGTLDLQWLFDNGYKYDETGGHGWGVWLKQIANAKIGTNVLNIGNWTFSNSTNLTSVIIPNSVTNIGSSAFLWCTNLTNIIIGNGVINIEYDAFSQCNSMKSFSVADDNPAYKSISGLLLTKDGKELIVGVNGNVEIPDGVMIICNNAFSDRSGITSLTIPNSVTDIGNYAFNGYSDLTDVYMGDGVATIGQSAFGSCNNLTNVIIGINVTNIGQNAFANCTSITDITIPNTVTSIGGSAFAGCLSLTNIIVEAQNPSYSSEDGILFSQNKTSLIAFPNGKSGDYTIPNSVTNIYEGAFSRCTNLTSVIIPNSVIGIRRWAFTDCWNITSITIPESVSLIWNQAFGNCIRLTEVIFENRTKAAVQKMYSYNNWFDGVPSGLILHCSDGDIEYN